MQQELISVIIPVYKVEPYLEKCVESVLAQTYEDLEIILVDDGSPDSCPVMCDAISARDSRVRVIHQKNGGLSAARNAGLDTAGGAYIGFVDSDDYIAPDMYEKLYAAMKETGADLAVCDVVRVDEGAGPVQEMAPLPRETLSPDQVHCRIAEGEWRYVTAWNRLYRRELFESLRFRVGKLHEDEFLVPDLLARCAAVAVIPEALYFYVQRQNSIMGMGMTLRSLDGTEAYMERYEFYRSQGKKPLAATALRRAYVRLWTVIDSVDVRASREVIGPWVRRVTGAQLRCLDLRAVYLAAHYAARLLRGAAGQGKNG